MARPVARTHHHLTPRVVEMSLPPLSRNPYDSAGRALRQRTSMGDCLVVSQVIPFSMTTREELEQPKRARRSVRPDDMDRLLIEAGFERRFGKGDHWVYTHPQRPYPLTIDPRNPLLATYVSKAIRAIEEILPDDP